MRSSLIGIRTFALNRVWGFNIHQTARVSFFAYLDKTYPTGIYIGEFTLVARGAMILSHDFTRAYRAKTNVGSYCLIGANALVLPGVSIGNHVIVGAGSVVTKDVPDCCIVAGNPAMVLRKVSTEKYGKIASAP